MTGAPVITARLDNGTGTFPHDITKYVSLRSGITVSCGRGDEFDDVDAATIGLTLKNDDGRFSLGSAAYACRPDQRLRLFVQKAGGGYFLEGYVQEWPTSWDGPLGNRASARIAVVDAQARYTRHTLGSMVEEEARVNGALAYFPLTEAEASVSGGSRLGNVPALVAAGSGTAPVFAVVDGPGWVDGMMPLFTGNGKMMRSRVALGASPSWTVAAFVSMTGSGGKMMLAAVAYPNAFSVDVPLAVGIGVTSTGQAFAYRCGENTEATAVSSTLINDGNVHHVAVRSFVVGAVTQVEVWVDGVREDLTGINSSFLPAFDGDYLHVGAVGTSGVSNVALSHVVVGPSSVDPVDLYAAGMTGFAGETASDRLLRIASYVGQGRSSAAVTVLSGQQLAGVKVWEAMKAVGASEGGRLSLSATGVPTLTSRQEEWSLATSPPVVVVPVGYIDHGDLVVQGDKQYLKNRVSGTRDGGAQQVAENIASRAWFDVYEDDLGTLLVLTDEEVYDRCRWVANMYGEPEPRLSSVTIDLLTAPTALVELVLEADVGSRIQVSDLPSQAPAPTVDLIVEGWSESVTQESWSRTLNTSPAAFQQPFTLNHTVFGVLDGPNPLAY